MKAISRAAAGSDVLRVSTAGSVDDGKSTLLGRLLLDLGALYLDEADGLRKAGNGTIDLAHVADGLRAEREQGITIDVAYRYFATPKRKFILADAPGHDQYTANLATAASNADVAVVVVDAMRGPTPQTSRHLRICRLMGAGQIVIAATKMDLAGWREARFRKAVAPLLQQAPEARAIPVSGLEGANVVRRACTANWYRGPTLLEILESATVIRPPASAPLRLPVQYVIRGEGRRWLAGTVAGGSLKKGDAVGVTGGEASNRVRSLLVSGHPASAASAGDAVAVELTVPADAGRGDTLVGLASRPEAAFGISADLVWLRPEAVGTGYRCLLKSGSATVPARLADLQPEGQLTYGESAAATLELDLPLYGDPYAVNRATGSFVLIDRFTNSTVAAGMICAVSARAPSQPSGLAVLLTGLSGAGKSTLARTVQAKLQSGGIPVEVMDGDDLRQSLGRGLGFSRADREENLRRAAFAAEMLVRQGTVVLLAMIAPYCGVRQEIRARLGAFMEVHVHAPLAVCERRDPKGLYRRARAGEIKSFTGLDDPYEPPLAPELVCRTDRHTVEQCAETLISAILARRPRNAPPPPAGQSGLAAALAALSQRSLTTEEFARIACLGKHTALRALRAATGKGFREFRREMLLERANQLLAAGTPVKHIAIELGFASTETFDRFYRAASGTNPRSARPARKSQ